MSSFFVSKNEVPLSSGAVMKCPLADCNEGAPHAPRSALLALFACFNHAPLNLLTNCDRKLPRLRLPDDIKIRQSRTR